MRLVGGAAFGGGVMAAAGALLGAATRNPTIAGSAVVGWNLGESLLAVAGIGPYLPFGLVTSLMGVGVGGDVPAPAAMGLLLEYLAAFALCVRQWALSRDLT